MLPEMIALFHGSDDKTIPCSDSIQLGAALCSAGVRVTTLLYSGWSHTHAILEGPFAHDFTLVEVLHLSI